MLNYIWSGMLFLGILWGAFNGRMAQVTEGALSAAGEAVTLSLTMVGIVAFWNGILEIGSRAGLVEQLSGKMRPILKFLFPDLPTDCEAARQISVNFIANILGLGWAATPAGLKAMKELEKIGKIIKRELPAAPHEVILALDATTGQNAIQQAKEFSAVTPITGIALTKLDGSAKGGIVLSIVQSLKIPVKLVGLGEGINDLTDFDEEFFVRGLFKELI